MGFIVALLGHVQQGAGTVVIGHWSDYTGQAWQAFVSYWYGLNGW